MWTTYKFLQIPSYSSIFLLYSASEKRCQVHRHGLRFGWFSRLVCIVHSTRTEHKIPQTKTSSPPKAWFSLRFCDPDAVCHKASPQLCCLQVFLIRFVSMIYMRFLCLTSHSPLKFQPSPTPFRTAWKAETFHFVATSPNLGHEIIPWARHHQKSHKVLGLQNCCQNLSSCGCWGSLDSTSKIRWWSWIMLDP